MRRRRKLDSSDLWRVAKLEATERQRQRWTWGGKSGLERGSCGHSRGRLQSEQIRGRGDRKKGWIVDMLGLEYGFLATRTAGGG